MPHGSDAFGARGRASKIKIKIWHRYGVSRAPWVSEAYTETPADCLTAGPGPPDITDKIHIASP